MHHLTPYGGTSLLQAIRDGSEEIALFLYSLGIFDLNMCYHPYELVLEEAESKKMSTLLLALLRDPLVKLYDNREYYLDVVFRVFCSYGNDWQDAILKRLALDLNRKFSIIGSTGMEVDYFFPSLVIRGHLDLVVLALNHPAIDIRDLDMKHLGRFTRTVFAFMHYHDLFASIVLRLNHAQRSYALRVWGLLALDQRDRQLALGTIMGTRTPQCLVPITCPNGEDSGFSHDQLTRDTTAERFGRIAYRLRRYGLHVFGLFLLYQEGYVDGKMGDGWKRYFDILLQLPLEMQMLMCRRLQGSAKDLFATKEIDGSLRGHLVWYGQYSGL
jgi:hypothetical protein